MSEPRYLGLKPRPSLEDFLEPTVSATTCRSCRNEYLGGAAQPLCPFCHNTALHRYLVRLQERRFLLQEALADVNGRIESLSHRLRRNTFVRAEGPAESTRCCKCSGWLHHGYAVFDREAGKYICRPCGIAQGIAGPYKKDEHCHHGHPITMCVPCRAMHNSKMRDARPPKTMRSSAPRRPREADLEDVPEI